MIDLEKMKTELIRDEGVRHSAYQDHLGFWTIGVGRLIDPRREGRLSLDEVEYLLENDIVRCLEDLKNEPYFLALHTDEQRRGLINMRFQLGLTGLRSFKNSLRLLKEKKFKEAADNLRKSFWYKQTPARAERVIRMIENG
jgi:lysozyme